MFRCPHPDHNHFYLVLHRNARPSLLVLAAQLALQGQVYVLDGGNWFNPQQVARVVRQKTLHTTAILKRIQVARAFTCFQMAELIQHTRRTHERYPAPTLVLDLLATFQDENVLARERTRVLDHCLDNLQQIKHHWGVVVSARPGHPEFISRLVQAADRVFEETCLPEEEE
jgi:hypothetical protein